MPQDELSGPNLAGVVADADAVGLEYVMRGGLPPLDYDTVARRAETTEWDGQTVRVAALPSVVGFKRLAGRPQDRLDLAELGALYDELPIEPIPGLDDVAPPADET
jgi:hypothetical protein